MAQYTRHLVLIAFTGLHAVTGQGSPIDRQTLVTRHDVTVRRADPLSPLSVGNGEFAFTADITGLQTFPAFHETGIPLATQSQWGWHEAPNPQGYRLSDARQDYDVHGRRVPYLSGQTSTGGYSLAAQWLRANPHRLDLGRIGLRLIRSDGEPAGIEDIREPRQTLRLWTGVLRSRFVFDDEPVEVRTLCHPRQDVLAIEVSSPLLKQGRMAVGLSFPYAGSTWGRAADWGQPERHKTRAEVDTNRADVTRILDTTTYYVHLAWSAGGVLRPVGPHAYALSCRTRDSLRIVVAFSPRRRSVPLPDVEQVEREAAQTWQRFWTTGGAIDFSGCTDPRASELERRVVLSEYLTAIQCAGSCPPQETGLTGNSWYGKFHLEMHWWHAVHFALWNRPSLLERSLPWYRQILPRARETAAMQGYDGARWPKMTSPAGRESPSGVGVFLIWQQPHPIYYAELCYRAHPDRRTLERYRAVVFATAEFLASYATWDSDRGRFVLGPALIPAQESYGRDRRRNLNPTFELAYWYWGLDTAQRWRERLGLSRHPGWERVLKGLAHPTVREGVYTGLETEPYTIPRDHPSMLAATGMLPRTPLIDADIMRATLDQVLRTWDWPRTWGWDYPLLAMTAARLGRPDQAVNALFQASPKNRYLANGHNYQSPRLPLYLPGNGGLLTAVAMMAAGWDGGPTRPHPGFPDDGRWELRCEGFARMP